MDYQHNINQANDYACLALERIHKENMAPIPNIYMLWYTYYSKTNIGLNQTVDNIVKNEKKITEEQCNKIYNKYLNDQKSEDVVKQVSDQVQDKISEIINVMKDVQSATSNYGDSLENVNNKLETSTSIDDFKDVILSLMDETKDMVKRNQELEQELDSSANTMTKMQQNLETFRKEALTDGLTNLANRKCFDQEIEKIAASTTEENGTLSLLMVDIDHFKSFNDNFGHQVGDQVLKLVAKTLMDGLKGRDMPARYGGEEFIVILPETNIKAASMVAEILRKAIAAKDLVNRQTGEKLGRITMSIGVSEYINGEETSKLIERADSALYTAKHNGRNQVACSQSKSQKSA